MVKKISKLPFVETPEQAEKLAAAIAAANGEKTMLMAVMQEAQEIYGYLPYEVQCRIAEGLDVPVEKVYGVATFYAVRALSQGQIQHLGVPRHCLLRKGQPGGS